MAEIRFLTNEAGKIEGLAYAGVETFKGSPYTSCARETGQNSRDAAVNDGRPVRVRFALHRIPRAQVPFAEQLERAISHCLAATPDAKTKQHLERALRAVSAAEIKVLEISDTNTTGLTGPVTDPRSVFAALVKGDGVTNKADETSAGSFGIGKNAAYAVSDLQTVIYSTCYLDATAGGTKKFAAQGRLRLISHADGSRRLSAEGYWGNPDFAAIEDSSSVPPWMRRTEIGTSIFSIGFREQDHWVDRMTLSLATNFFLAIDRNEIEFSVGDNVQINRASLDSILASPELERIANDTDQLEDLHRAKRLLECIRSEVSSRHSIDVPGLGRFDLHLLVKESMPREVHVLRNGIYITDNFAKFSEPMRRFPGVREFTAVVEPAPKPDGARASALLKQLENPAHDAFEPERIVDADDRDLAKKQIKMLIKRTREIIRSIAKIDELRSSHVDELAHLFAVSSQSGTRNKEEDPASFIYGSARRGRRTRPPGASGTGGGRGSGGGRRNSGRRAQKKSTVQPVSPFQELRSVMPEPSNPRKRVVFFTPSLDGLLELSVSAMGLSGNVELPIVDSSSGVASDGRVTVSVKKNTRVAVDLTLAEPFAGAIELTVTSAKQLFEAA